jgi:hypothetical protein
VVQRGIRLAVISLPAVVLCLLLAACAPPPSPIIEQGASTVEFEVSEGRPETAISPGAIPPREPRSCPDLDSQLFQLTQADDPPRAAEQLGFRVQDGKVQVLLVLASEDSAFLGDYGVEIGTQSDNQVQAFAPIDLLCELADTDPVLAIRPLAQAVPQP